jgi:predicted ester cyclase
MISIVHGVGGKIAERWSQSDVAGLRRQLDDG